MASFSGLGISLCVVFGCLFLALVAELYYLLWWKKKITSRGIEDEDYGKESHSFEEQDLELGTSKDLIVKAFSDQESVESELMRLHNLSGPPRFLFTIKEETKEDLESEDGRSRKGSRTRSLSDIILAVDPPFLTPLASPRLSPLDCYNHHGFNPLFESSTDAEIYRLRSSPPPKFKFLRDAEEKLYKRLMKESEKRESKNGIAGSTQHSTMAVTEETEGSFLGFIISKNSHNHTPQYPSSSSQVLPLATSPPGFTPLDKKP